MVGVITLVFAKGRRMRVAHGEQGLVCITICYGSILDSHFLRIAFLFYEVTVKR